MLNYFKKLLTISAVLVSIHATAQEMNIQLAQKGHAVDQSLYGIFFEEINHAGDGGLYAELVKNRRRMRISSTLPHLMPCAFRRKPMVWCLRIQAIGACVL